MPSAFRDRDDIQPTARSAFAAGRRHAAAVLFRIALSLALLGGCVSERDARQAIARALPAETDRFARDYVDMVRRGDLQRAVAALSPLIRDTAMARDSLAAAARVLPAAPLDAIRAVGVQWVVANGVRRQQVTYEVHGATGWAAVLVIVAEELGLRYVEGFRVEPLAAPLVEVNAFTLRGKGASFALARVLLLALAVVCTLTTIVGAVVAARTPMPRRWLWAVGALVGFGRLTFNWTTGEADQAMAWAQLLAVGVFRQGLAGPWLISISCPVLALVALDRVRRFRQARDRASIDVTHEGAATDRESFVPDH